ncbi:MAG: biotin--protein ligase [Proteobacteria bacterium]|nr:biotin--protein ligase [Pseudomonadota bacterium]
MARVFVLWDESHLWGVLVLRALRALGLPHVILRAHDIAEGALAGKSTASAPFAPFGGFMGGGADSSESDTPAELDTPALLIVPGGWARGRAERLGARGMQAIRDFVAAGGSYLGFCGGAGLALTSPKGPRAGDSLGLCPWGRMGFAGRLQHFLSGHVRLSLDQAQPLALPGAPEILAPVWWPAQFAPPPKGQHDDVRVLARYAGLGQDFWVADLNLALLPEETLSDWENLYGLQIRPDFLQGRPAVISGTYGQGRYVLSYPHLETPDSPAANAWLAHLLRELGSVDCPNATIPPWHVGTPSVGAAQHWEDPALLAAKAAVERAIAVGESHLLLFWRSPWLLGWRRGLPGPGINSVYALICEALSAAPPAAGSPALAYWAGHGAEFARLAELFCSGLSGLLLAERLDMTVRTTEADQAFTFSLRETRRALFGTAPAMGGLCGELLGMLEELCGGLWGEGRK